MNTRRKKLARLGRRIAAVSTVLSALGLVGGVALPGEASPPAGIAAVAPGVASAAPRLGFGTLGSQPGHAASDAAAGMMFATVTVGWNMWEPGPGQYNASWAAYLRNEISGFESHGLQVVVELGLQYTPSWVLDLPNGQLVDQNGRQSGTPNYEWNPTVQQDMYTFVKSVVNGLAPVHPLAYRIGLSNSGEMLYADNSAGSWWAYGDAQATSPMPGWVPGQTTWKGAPVTRTQVDAWYSWYLFGLVNAEHAEINAIRNAGYTGHLLLVMPGDGTTPSQYTKRLAADLGDAARLDTFGTMDTGAVWWLQLRMLNSWDALGGGDFVDVSSVGDSTGVGACQAGDTGLSLAQADPWVSGWDDTRWLSYLARINGLGVVGENPGGQTGAQLTAIVGLARSCGFNGFFWQSDASLYAGGTGATLADYAAAIAGG